MENEPKKVEIIWVDAWSDDAHLKLGVVDDFIPVERHNVGFLIRRDEIKVIIAQGILNNLYEGEVLIAGFWLIPSQAVKEIKTLEYCTQPVIVEGNGSTSPDSVTVGSDSMTWKT